MVIGWRISLVISHRYALYKLVALSRVVFTRGPLFFTRAIERIILDKSLAFIINELSLESDSTVHNGWVVIFSMSY